MTCIVGIIDKRSDKVFIGGDSAGVAGLDVSVRKDVKVFKVGDFVIGYTHPFRMGQLLRYSFHPPKHDQDIEVYQYMCTSFINALRDCFKAGGFGRNNSGEESGGTFLVGYKGRLFEIQSDYQVAESVDDFNTCGCGYAYALGALETMNKDLSAEVRINEALRIATKFSAGVRPPFVIENT